MAGKLTRDQVLGMPLEELEALSNEGRVGEIIELLDPYNAEDPVSKRLQEALRLEFEVSPPSQQDRIARLAERCRQNYERTKKK